MRIIGMDLAVKAEHRAVVVDERGRFVTPVLKLTTRAEDLAQLLTRAREGAPRCKLGAVMEPTGMAWFPVAVYLIRQGVTVYLVNSQAVIDLRRVHHRYAKSDRIDTRVLAQLPLHDPELLHPLTLGGAVALACQRGCAQLERRTRQSVALKNRLKATLRFAWPGIEAVFADLDAVEARWFAEHWLDPRALLHLGVNQLQRAWQESGLKSADSGAWAPALVTLAQDVLALYGPEPRYLDFESLQAEVQRDLALLTSLEAQAKTLRLKTVRPLYRQLQPDRYLETIPGVGQEGGRSTLVSSAAPTDLTRRGSSAAGRAWCPRVRKAPKSSPRVCRSTTPAHGSSRSMPS